MSKDVLVAIGEALIDFIPDKSGCGFDEAGAFLPKAGGAPANVCGAYAKLGGRSRLLTQLGDDLFGHKIYDYLSRCAVDMSCVRFTREANTALAFVSLDENGGRTFSFYRDPSADMLYSPEFVAPEYFDDAYALHFCSVSLGDFPMKDAHRAAIDFARERGVIVSFDPNLRFPLWKSRDALFRAVNEFLPLCDVLKISDEELEFITGETDIKNALPKLFSGSVRLVIYTCGSLGAYAFTCDTGAFCAVRHVKAVDTTGAGDGFIGSFLWKLHDTGITADGIDGLSEAQLFECLKFSNEFCAKSVQASGAIDSYPDMKE